MNFCNSIHKTGKIVMIFFIALVFRVVVVPTIAFFTPIFFFVLGNDCQSAMKEIKDLIIELWNVHKILLEKDQ